MPTRSPIYSHISNTIDGLTISRAFEAQDILLQQYYRYQNEHTATWFLQCCTARLLGILLDMLSCIYICIVIIILIIYKNEISGRGAGLAFSSIITLTGITQWGVKRTVDAEIWMTSVSRLRQYCKLPLEEVNPNCNKPPNNWPIKGDILMQQVSMAYPHTSKLILKNINIKIRGGEKIGIVGRTGAGKSSMIAALFRLCESSGQLIIDDVNIKDIKLQELRNKLSIIPQEPFAFNGSLRNNLDPFGEHSDNELWQVLEEVQLKEVVYLLPNKLMTIISDNLFNFSVGQRQLICLARAILRKNKILILDEATANVDYKTDAFIQQTIKHKFSSCTVITVAHRIETVIDSDRILVMDDGKIIESGSPHLLLQQENSIFAKLVRQTGHLMKIHLNLSAQKAYNKKLSNSFSKQNDVFVNSENVRLRKVF